jgi:UDP-N-acetylmuramoylalanine-D-glutamate ligase
MKINELKKYSNKKIAILGLGKEGKSSIDFLEKIGYKMITILDKTPPNLPLSGEKRKRYKVIS